MHTPKCRPRCSVSRARSFAGPASFVWQTLHLARLVVEAHGGSVRAYSDGPGHVANSSRIAARERAILAAATGRLQRSLGEPQLRQGSYGATATRVWNDAQLERGDSRELHVMVFGLDSCA